MSALPCLLVTAFEPFGADTVNASAEVLRLLPDEIGPWRIEKRLIPVVFGKGAETVIRYAEETRARAVLCLGQSSGRASVTPEQVAINLRDASIPDNAGHQPRNEPVAAGGPDALFATLPAAEMADAIRAAGLPGTRSLSAGTFVCNDVLYSVLLHFRGSAVRAGFIHVPALPGQHGIFLPATVSAAAVETAVRSQLP
ncbi:MAG: pyroglutamyl-peptidase I [Clostridia bacterium]|nr:pyroglutamyl-peptidase I [Clostridia bacterium]